MRPDRTRNNYQPSCPKRERGLAGRIRDTWCLPDTIPF
jgi:hypothetical protein